MHAVSIYVQPEAILYGPTEARTDWITDICGQRDNKFSIAQAVEIFKREQQIALLLDVDDLKHARVIKAMYDAVISGSHADDWKQRLAYPLLVALVLGKEEEEARRIADTLCKADISKRGPIELIMFEDGWLVLSPSEEVPFAEQVDNLKLALEALSATGIKIVGWDEY